MTYDGDDDVDVDADEDVALLVHEHEHSFQAFRIAYQLGLVDIVLVGIDLVDTVLGIDPVDAVLVGIDLVVVR